MGTTECPWCHAVYGPNGSHVCPPKKDPITLPEPGKKR